eukprot:TRINITY_DN11717_c0_g1_i1.p1 TRINITY_DN11717_c0_g1~~TRINITY_DN11717_c0_g1_i1.p1  ORF type:complete len:752 (-),score=136.35 TRINITY_DN11717_c0_g1_i1:92-2152(-)
MAVFFEHPMIKTAFAEGVDVKVHRQNIYNQLITSEQDTLELYRTEKENIIKLYRHLDTCDSVLNGLDGCLSSFEQSLSERISEIHEMQREAKLKLVRMQNHQKISEELSAFLNDVYLPENLTRAIARGKINQSYVQYLDAFSAKITFIETMSANDVLAVKEQKQVVKDLITRACEKIHKWLLSKMTSKIKSVPSLKKRQGPLQKYSSLFHFLLKHNPKNAEEVVNKYVEIVTKIYGIHFRHYLDQIGKMCLEIADKNDTIAEPEHKNWGFFTPKVLQMKKKTPVYSLAQRQATISNLDQPFPFPNTPSSPDAAANAQKSKETHEDEHKHPFEVLFRSIHWMLLELIHAEHNFCKNFFTVDYTERLFSRTLNILSTYLGTYIESSYDAIGLLIIQCVMYTYQHSSLISSVEGTEIPNYFKSRTPEIQKRFSFLIQQHKESALSADPDDLGEINFCGGHYVTRRYAELLASILVLHKEFPEALKPFSIEKEMKPLRVAVSGLLGKLGDLLSDQKQEKVLFLINNYDVILSVSSERCKSNTQDTQHFESLLVGLTDKYVNLQLQKHFNGIIQFVKKHAVPDGAAGEGLQISVQPTCEPRVIEDLLRGFAENDYWKNRIEDINKEIMKSFHNFETGTMIFQKVLSSLFEHYSCLLDIIGSNTQFRKLRDSKFYIPKTELTYMMRSFTSFL